VDLILRRFLVANNSTLGILTGLDKTIYILEDEWKNNARNISCIPPGTYEAVPHGWDAGSPVRFKQTWRLLGVPNRSAILVHGGNTKDDTEGCLLVGMGFIVSQLASRTTDSQIALGYMRNKIGEKGFTLKIIDSVVK